MVLWPWVGLETWLSGEMGDGYLVECLGLWDCMGAFVLVGK